MKKICFSCPTLLLRRPIAEIIPYLKRCKVSLFTPRDLIRGFLKIHYNKFKNVKILKYSIINPPFLSSEWPIPVSPIFIIRMLKLLKKNDIIHMWVPFYIGNSLLAILKKLFFPSKKLYLTMDTFPGISFRMGKIKDILFRLYYNTLGKIVFSAADKIILYGTSMIKFAFQAGILKNKIKIIPSGVNVKVKSKEKDIKKEFKIKKEDLIVLFVGLINERKGVDIFIKTAYKLKNQNIIFFIVGDGPKRKDYEKLVEKYGLKDKVIFTGFRKDIHNFYNEADLFFLPSRGEGLAGVIMESFVHEVPVVSSDIAGTRDLIKNNENGFLCKSENISCFSKKIEILLKDKSLRKKFIDKSKEIIETRYNWKVIIEKILRLYSNPTN
ncbi:MAG: glycosyltransferase [Promethearchaeota archaeon]